MNGIRLCTTMEIWQMVADEHTVIDFQQGQQKHNATTESRIEHSGIHF